MVGAAIVEHRQLIQHSKEHQGVLVHKANEWSSRKSHLLRIYSIGSCWAGYIRGAACSALPQGLWCHRLWSRNQHGHVSYVPPPAEQVLSRLSQLVQT